MTGIKYKLFLIFFIFITGCASFEPAKLPEIKFDETPKYEVDISSIKKPEKINPIFVDSGFNEVLPNEADYVVLLPKEYAKVSALLKMLIAYKDIIYEQEHLVNIQIDINNSLKEYLELENNKAKIYRDLWADSENMYRETKRMGTINSIFYKVIIGGLSIAIMTL